MSKRMIVPSYFGKIPSRDDFVSSGNADHALVRHVDRWLGLCMSELARHPGWQAAYDTALPFDFLVASKDNVSVVCGRATPGRDHCGRRSPLMGTLRIDAGHPLAFTATAPLAFEQAWQGIDNALTGIMLLPRDTTGALPAGEPCAVRTSPRNLHALLDEYVATESSTSLDTLLAAAGHTNDVVSVTRSLLRALMAVRMRPKVRIERGMVLPLPTDPLRRNRLASFWLDLIVTALGDRDVELVAILTQDPNARLIVSFDGTRGSELIATWMPENAVQLYVNLMAPDPDIAFGRYPLPSPSTLAQLRQAFIQSLKETAPCAA